MTVNEDVQRVNDTEDRFSPTLGYRERLAASGNFREVWEIVKDSVEDVLGLYRVGMMLFLDDLPLRLGAYHPVGTNNIVMNRALLEMIEISIRDKVKVNSFVYSILLHEYIHALGYLRESETRPLVLKISRECFGVDHVVSELARTGPWSILKGLSLTPVQGSRRIMEVVKDFEASSQNYIV